jgi:hypothetical protein
MNRTLVNFWLNTGLLFAYVALFWSSIVLHVVFPPGPDAAGWTLWGWSYLDWRGFQFANVVLLTLGILLHVMLHWSWVCGVISTKIRRSRTRPDDGTQTLYGVGLLIVLLVLIGSATAAARLSLRSPHRGAAGAEGSLSVR